MTEDTSSSSLDRDSTDYWANLRLELKDWKNSMKVSDREIADGLGISRQVVNQFMRWEGIESEETGAKPTLFIYRQDLIALWKYITSEGQIDKIKSQKVKDVRLALRAKTANDLLEKSGFLGINRQSIVADDPSKLEKIHRIIFRLRNESLTSRDIWKIEEMVINQLAQLQSSHTDEDKESTQITGIDNTKKWLGQRYTDIDRYWREVESTLKRYQDLGRKSFKESELLELFQNTAENQKLRKNGYQKIRVVHCGIKTINSVYKRLSDLKSPHDNVLRDVLQEGILIERRLRGIKEDKLSFNLMSEVTLTCKLYKDKEITWFYRSCSSTIDNIISAIQQGIGHDLELRDLSSHVLADGSDSIVRVSAILKNKKGDYYTGRWVDMDTILSFAQAIIIATENWIKDNILIREEYENICGEVAEILVQVDILMRKPHEYDIQDRQSSNENITTPELIKKCIERINKILKSIHGKSGVYTHYAEVLKENKRYCQLAQVRDYHSIGDVECADLIIDQIVLEEQDADLKENPFNASNILFKIARMMQRFYVSEEDFFADRLWNVELVEIEREIEKYLKKGKGVSFLTDSLYHALAELYGNISRFEFYNCGLEKYNIKRLETAVNHSKSAVYFAMKIDDEKRACQWLARCSRILCRLNRSEEAEQYLWASQYILKRSVMIQDEHKKRSETLMLEINIANGEQCLLNEKYRDAVKYFVDALQGAIHPRLARIIAGSLYGIYRASNHKNIDISEVLQNLDAKTKEDIRSNYSRLLDSYNSLKMQESLDDVINSINHKNIELIYESIKILKDAVDDKAIQHNVLSRKFRSQAIEIWNSWVPQSPNNNPQHSISRHMELDSFLGIIKEH